MSPAVTNTEANPVRHEDHQSVYDGLLVNDAHWAFGTDFEDPLAGVDTTIPEGLDPHDLALYCLMLGDDALVLSHRLSEWCSNAPDLEEDIALANIALDLLGQARLLLARAAAADPSVVPALPPGSPVPAEDAFAFFRSAGDFRNVRLVEAPNGDFAETITRLLLFSSHRLEIFRRLAQHPDAVLAAVAAKGVKELAYHRDFAARWFVTLAQGTDVSRQRTQAALARAWPLKDELTQGHDVEIRVGVDPATTQVDLTTVLTQVLSAAALDAPKAPVLAGVNGLVGRDGMHTEALSLLLAEMQVVAREHPMGTW